MKRRRFPKIPRLQKKDLWIAFFVLVLMVASVPSLEPTPGAGSQLAGQVVTSSGHVVTKVVHAVARLY